MLTDRGWAALGAGLALGILWVLLGEIELLGAGALLVVTAVVAIALTRYSSPDVAVVRRIDPSLVHEGDTVTVDARVTNRAKRPSLNLSLIDEVGALGSAEFAVGLVRAGQTVSASYRILCRPRGVYPVGPAMARVGDPLGMAERQSASSGVDRLVVYPAVEDLIGFPMTRGRDPATHASKPEFSNRGGEDFYTLREYVTGDDLRYVHWPSSAKRDELLIRQLETPWQSRALVVLDVRRQVYENADCFEQAVRGAASVIRHLSRSGFDAELWAGGATTVHVRQYTAAMEQLATVSPHPKTDIRAVAARIRQTGGGGALVLVTGVADHDLLEAHRLLSRDYRTALLMSATETTTSTEPAFQRSGALTLRTAPGESWAQAWTNLRSRTWHAASVG